MPALSVPRSSFNVPPAEKVNLEDEEGTPVRYLAVLGSLDSREVPKYDNPQEKQTRVVWSYRIHNQDGTPVLNQAGDIFTIEEWTGTSTGPKSKARPWVTALGGGVEPETYATADDMEAAIMDKPAWAFLEEREFQGRDGQKQTRLGILRLMAVKDAAKAQAVIGAASVKTASAPGGLPF